MTAKEEGNEQQHISITFYQWQFAATLVWWILVRALVKKNLDDITQGSVFTCPSWLSDRLLHQLQLPKHRRIVFVASLFSLAVGGGWGFAVAGVQPPDQTQQVFVRFAVALVFSLYHLVESSVTHRHGEYPLLYNVWAMCLPSLYASAASWGIAIHFVWSTGIGKIWVGGGTKWMAPSTMRFYLTTYYNAKMKLSRPCLPSLNRWVCQRSWATVLISVFTILLECGLVPLTLLLPASLRWIGCTGMVLMHLGIFLIMSKKVGIVFATTLPTYLVGFQCTADIKTTHWWLAVSVALLPTLLSFGVLGATLPENWPSSPVLLFMWSGEQAKVLADTLMTRDTRVVLCTSDKSAKNIVGLPVIHHGSVAASTSNKNDKKAADQAVHDCVLRVIGFTILHKPLLKNEAVPKPGCCQDDWDVNVFVRSLRLFLESDRRLFETQSGQPLVNAYFVRLDPNGNVQEVLSKS